MTTNNITLTIEKLAGLGDGMGTYDGRKIYVPYTLVGDVVRATIVRKTADADYGVLDAILTPSEQRIQPVCRHFGECGGCALQHVAPAMYTDFKQQMAEHAVRKAGFSPDVVQPLISVNASSRRRVELKIENGKLGYYAQGSHRLVDIETCTVLEPALLQLVLSLKTQLADVKEVIGMQINGVDGGYDIVLECNRLCTPSIASDTSIKRISVRSGAQWQTLFEAGPVTVMLGTIQVEVPPGAFLQASGEAQSLMIAWVKEAVGNAKHLLDLFAGIGTYSFPLSAHTDITAIEGEGAMVKTMNATAGKLGLKKVRAEKHDLFHSPVSAEALKPYDAVIINPPRLGAKKQCEQLALSCVPKIIMVSCSPATFSRDARILKEGGYRLKRVTPIDQFVYSSHLELMAEFIR